MSPTTAEAPPAPAVEAISKVSTPLPLDRDWLKAVVKEAVAEALREQRTMLAEVVVQAIDDIAFARAIDEGRDTEIVPIEELFKILDAAPCGS